jgi:putative endonuclease
MNNKDQKKLKKKHKDKADNRTEKRKTGDLGENLACKYLESKGFKVLERNYLKKYGEIDIVAQKQGIYHFVEVKTVTMQANNVTHVTTDSYKPEENVDERKLRRLSRVIETYILDKKLFEHEWVFDVITVSLNMETRLAKVIMINNIVI